MHHMIWRQLLGEGFGRRAIVGPHINAGPQAAPRRVIVTGVVLWATVVLVRSNAILEDNFFGQPRVVMPADYPGRKMHSASTAGPGEAGQNFGVELSSSTCHNWRVPVAECRASDQPRDCPGYGGVQMRGESIRHLKLDSV